MIFLRWLQATDNLLAHTRHAAGRVCFAARSPGYEAERVALGISAHAPSHHLATRAWTGRDALASNCSPCGYYPSLSSIKIADQDVEMHAARKPIAISGFLEGKPLTMRRWFQCHPAWIPLHRPPTEQPGPEGRQAPEIRSVQHNLAYPPDRRILVIAHQPIITWLPSAQARLHMNASQGRRSLTRTSAAIGARSAVLPEWESGGGQARACECVGAAYCVRQPVLSGHVPH
jgi:hypothetical protein